MAPKEMINVVFKNNVITSLSAFVHPVLYDVRYAFFFFFSRKSWREASKALAFFWDIICVQSLDRDFPVSTVHTHKSRIFFLTLLLNPQRLPEISRWELFRPNLSGFLQHTQWINVYNPGEVPWLNGVRTAGRVSAAQCMYKKRIWIHSHKSSTFYVS